MLALSALLPHKEALFISCAKPDLAAKLTDMGMLPGTRWQLLGRMPFYGPLLIGNERARLSIRHQDSQLIWMEPVE